MTLSVSRQKLVENKLVVSSPEDMDNQTFIKHMNFRHTDSLGGLAYLSEHISGYLEECYRSFHYRLHRVRVDLEHEHVD